MTADSLQPSPPQKSPRRLLLIVGAVALAVALTGIGLRLLAEARLRDLTADEAITTVAIIAPVPGGAEAELVLPGDLRAYADAPIYARTSGYVKQRFVDIGDAVKKGQVLAELDTPEVDQQMRQAQADLATAQANASLANASARRWENLRSSEAVSPQEADEKVGEAAAKNALLAAAEANLQRLRDLQNFKRITAPFDGVVTARNTDIGALVNAGGDGSELFRIADTRTLRIYVEVPQANVRDIKIGGTAQLTLIDRPEQNYTAKVVRTARALDPATRSLRVELNLDNRRVQLLPGAFARLRFPVPTSATQLRLPINTLLFRPEGPLVATVDANNQVRMRPVTIVQDFGNAVAIGTGVTPQDRVVMNPPESLADGQSVRVAAASTAAGKPAK